MTLEERDGVTMEEQGAMASRSAMSGKTLQRSGASATRHSEPGSEPLAVSQETPDRVRGDDKGKIARKRPRPVRHNEWTRAKMGAFLRELAATQSVTAAAKSVGMTRQSAYRLKNRLVGTPFALGWEVALEAGLSQLAHAALERAVHGVEVPHYHAGELVGTHRRFDERLTIWLLSNPWKVGRAQVAREWTSEGFDKLLDRIEHGPLDWQPDDQPPGIDPPAPSPADAAERQRTFITGRSWYADAAPEGKR